MLSFVELDVVVFITAYGEKMVFVVFVAFASILLLEIIGASVSFICSKLTNEFTVFLFSSNSNTLDNNSSVSNLLLISSFSIGIS